ncbi:MAG TPA: hypothetical protein V6C52_11440 [Coleofasciculaceae cyanobacterium]|jgi:hypothetical protein
MASISFPVIQQAFQTHDINKDGKLDVPEIAKASLNLLGNGDQTGGSFFATLLQGGNDRRGMFPDYNGDQAVDVNELGRLASANGDPNAIDATDFQSVFGPRYQAGGAGADMNFLQQVAGITPTSPQASVQQPQFSQMGGYPPPPLPPNGNPGPVPPPATGGNNQQVMMQMVQMMMQMMQLMMSSLGRK